MTRFLRGEIPWPLAALLALALQTGALGWLLYDRVAILRSGTEITLTPEPVDPRDLFRGDYVILNYPFSRTELERADVSDPTPLWARLKRTADGSWALAGLSQDKPTTGPDEAALKAIARSGALSFGIERYYVPEGEGEALEALIGRKAIQVVVAVAEDGRAAIKGLKVDGALVFEEPWF